MEGGETLNVRAAHTPAHSLAICQESVCKHLKVHCIAPAQYSLYLLQVATAGAQALLRLGSGAFVSGNLANFKNRPSKPIELYEFEGCPFCR